MLNLSPSIGARFKEARRSKGLNQSALARMVGCQQSAISMFEGGMTTKLSDEMVGKLSDVLGVPLEEAKPAGGAADGGAGAGVADEGGLAAEIFAQPLRGYCPNGHCPSNVPYVVEGRLFLRPSRAVAAPTGGKYCAVCGELLEMRCPVCGAPLNEGACCAVCGRSYVTPALPEGVDVQAYARARREEIASLRALVS